MRTVDGVADFPGDPTVVSVSDVHGYRDRFESALLTLADHPDFEPLVERGDEGDDPDELRWVGDDDYVLVVNGDVVDRGPDSWGCLELVRELQRQAPAGHVRHLAGNHELYLAYPSPPEWDRWASGDVDDDLRRRFYDHVRDGAVTLAFEGHEYAYVHAGSPDGVDAAALNESFRDLGEALRGLMDREDEVAAFDRTVGEVCPAVAHGTREDPDAGVVWLDFSHLPADAPPQVVGHTPHEAVTRTGNVVCGDVITANADSPGGEAVLVETPDALRALVREPGGGVQLRDV